MWQWEVEGSGCGMDCEGDGKWFEVLEVIGRRAGAFLFPWFDYGYSDKVSKISLLIT